MPGRKRVPKTAEEQLAEVLVAKDLEPSQTAQDAPGSFGQGRLAAAMALGNLRPPRTATGALAPVPMSGAGLVGVALGLAEEAYALRVAGYQTDEITNHLNVTRCAKEGRLLTEQEVIEMLGQVSQKRQNATQQTMSSVFQVELDRIEKLIKGIWDSAIGGNEAAIDRVVRLMKSKADLLGLNAPEVRATFHVNATDIDYARLNADELRTLRSLMAKATPVAELGGRQEKTVGEVLMDKQTSATKVLR